MDLMDDSIGVPADAIQKALDQLDGARDRDKLIWAHGLITGILNQINARILSGRYPQAATLDLQIRKNLESARSILDSIHPPTTDEPSDSLERACADLEDGNDLGADPSPV